MPSTAAKTPVKSVFQNDFAEAVVNVNNNQKSLHAVKAFKAGELVCNFEAKETFTEANYLTIQTGINKHISLLPELLQYTNHSCNPNVFFDTTTMQVIALRDIEINDELCFFYPSSEWEMSKPFLCFCGSKDCLQNISGAAGMEAGVLKNYRLTDFIQSMLHLNNGK